jgi:NADH-quinone oxidoreductase subunit G
LKSFAKSAFGKAFKAAQKPMVIVGAGALSRDDGAAIANLAASFATAKDGWNGFNVLHTAASRVGGLDMGFVPAKGGLSAVDMVEAHGFRPGHHPYDRWTLPG